MSFQAYLDAIEEYKDTYDEAYYDNYNKEIDKYDLHILCWRQAIKKLTKDEIEAIRKLGL